MNITNQPPKTWTGSGYFAVLEHEAITDDLCDFFMELKKLTGSIMLGEEVNEKLADWLPTGLSEIIAKYQDWEERNLVR